MKYLFVLLFLIGCYNKTEPKFKIGDCIRTFDENAESWQKRNAVYIMKIEKVGKKAYYTSTFYASGKTKHYGEYLDTIDFTGESVYEKVGCP